MLITVTAKCPYSGRPECLLIPETSIVSVNVFTTIVVFREGDKVRGGEMDAAEVYRLKLERIPAPAGIMLDGRAVLYVERDPAHSNAVISSMAEDGTVVLTDVSIRDATVYDEDRAAAEAVVDKVLASEPAKKRRRKAASGSGAN
jgi:hypothetical protein